MAKRRKQLAAVESWVTTLRLVREGPAVEHTTNIRGAPDVYRFMQPYFDRETVEVLWVIMLDNQLRVIGNAPVEVTRGIVNSSLSHAREVYRAAIMVGATSIVLVHNHPSGNPTHTQDDTLVTHDIKRAGEIIGIPLRDHLIMGSGRYMSYAESGML